MSWGTGATAPLRSANVPVGFARHVSRAEEDLSVPKRKPLSETAPVNPVLLSKNSFRSYSCWFVRLAVQKIKFYSLHSGMSFLFTVKCFALILLCMKNRIQAKHLSVTENPQTRSCCKPDPVRLSGCSADRKWITPWKKNCWKFHPLLMRRRPRLIRPNIIFRPS